MTGNPVFRIFSPIGEVRKKIGMMEEWNNGIMEQRGDGIMEG